jgi:Tfp pilus assembly protein PilO
MNPQLQKQILLGALAGIIVSGLVWFLLGGKRDEVKALDASIEVLQQEVNKGVALKANAEKLRQEIAQQKIRIDELIKIMPNEQDRGELPYRIKKLADTAGIEQQLFANEGPIKKEFYTEYPVKFEFRAGYHSLGQFASLISGYEKIINLSDIVMVRDASTRGVYAAKLSCKVSAFIYNPNSEAASPAPSEAPKPVAAPAKSKSKGESD